MASRRTVERDASVTTWRITPSVVKAQPGVVQTGVDLLSASVKDFNANGETYVIVELSGEADATNSEKLREVLDAEIRKQPRAMIIDLSGLRFMDSTALHVILRANRTLDRYGCVLTLVAPRDPVAKVLRLTATDRLIPVYSSVSDATAQS
jgi:anti-sigma B factor antagonist